MRQFNVVVLGAGGVGKSALTIRFVRDVFASAYDPTIGRSFWRQEQYHRPIMVDGEQDALEVLDTAGAEQFTSLNEVYIKVIKSTLPTRHLQTNAHNSAVRSWIRFGFQASLVSDLKEVESLRKQIFRIKGTENVPIVVVGTKSDLVNEREVTTSTIESLASRWSLPFYETSAKRNWHVNDVFEDLTRQMRIRYPPEAAKKAKKKQQKGPCVIM
ncbi:hypothetical protein MSAN_00395400 [Mycena sanguinolenta]|uniref:Uncharacterized protein n=1 Tax=Mycena sanguinolenta TaxID=230812 RepID=A0A8H6Z9P2_9AGAR|nr:hypothetical protein MSAN_00395400 [Mycena sanguinolenta]